MTPLQAAVWRAWDRTSIYLPVILMGVMALATYWLARNTPSATATGAPPTLTHEPDYFMRGFSVKSFDAAGRLKSEIRGTEARHFPDNDTVEIDQPRLRSFGEQGQLTTGSARRALSNGDGSEVQLIGDAVVTREPQKTGDATAEPMEIRGEFLHLFVQKEELRSNRPVVLRRGADEFRGDGIEYNHLDRVLQLRGNVRGQLTPRSGR